MPVSYLASKAFGRMERREEQDEGEGREGRKASNLPIHRSAFRHNVHKTNPVLHSRRRAKYLKLYKAIKTATDTMDLSLF